MHSRIIVIIAGILLVCLSTETRAFQGESKEVIRMEKTACYGFCPVYTLTIYKNRWVYYEGKEYVERKGRYRARLSRKEMRLLKRRFIENDFFGFEDHYRAPLSDLPATYLSFRRKGQYKKIEDYHGAPEELKELEMQLEQMLEELPWKPY